MERNDVAEVKGHDGEENVGPEITEDIKDHWAVGLLQGRRAGDKRSRHTLAPTPPLKG